MVKTIKSLKEMDKFASEILSKISPSKKATILSLSGDLGAGKTAFVKSLAKNLGVKKIVQSPTFVVMKLYDISYKIVVKQRMPNNKKSSKKLMFKKLVHIDAYRIEKDRELEILGWSELIKNPENLICIEWPERVKKLVQKSTIKIRFKFVDDKTRTVTM